MKFKDDWKHIIRKAWSVRLMAVAAVLSGIEVALPFFASEIPLGTFAIASAAVTAAALVARVVAQKDI
jgi:hypothetical protein